MIVVLEKIWEEGLHTLKNLFEFAVDWYEDPNYNLHFIRVNKDHFFVLRKYRRNNIGKQAAIQAFKIYNGKWRVSEFDWNTPAQMHRSLLCNSDQTNNLQVV